MRNLHLLRVLALASFAAFVYSCESSAPTGPASMTGYQVVTGDSTSVPTPLGYASVTALCPGSKVVVGGGFTTMNAAANVFESAPLPSGTGWRVSIRNENLAGPSISFVPVAVCVDRPGGYGVVVGMSTDLSMQQLRTNDARCQDATFNLTGGGVIIGDAQVHPFASRPGTGSQPSWVVSAKSNWALPSSSSLSASVICASLRQVPAQTVVTSPPTTLGPGAATTLTVMCPPGTRALSGGFSADQSLATFFDSAPTPMNDGWAVGLHNAAGLGGPTLTNVTVSSVCATAAP